MRGWPLKLLETLCIPKHLTCGGKLKNISGPPERRVSSYLCRLVEFTRWGQKRNAKSTLCTLILHGNCAVYLCTCKYFCYKAPDWSIQVRKVHKYELFRWTPIVQFQAKYAGPSSYIQKFLYSLI